MKPNVENLDLLEANPGHVTSALMELADAIIHKDIEAEDRKTRQLARAMGEGMALADLLGRRRVWVDAKALASKSAPPRASFSSFAVARFTSVASRVPKVPFVEAFDDLVSRTPELAKNAQEVREAYGLRHGFALFKLPTRLADTARLTLTKRIQNTLASYLQKGVELKTAREQLSAIGGFTKAYAETVYRTNMASAYTAGRMKQLRDPDVQDIVPAVEYTAVHDSDARPNHMAADGTIASIDASVWSHMSPPAGFNCRCDFRSVTRDELKSRGLLMRSGHVKPYYPPTFSAAHPDPGFRHVRPDLSAYGG